MARPAPTLRLARGFPRPRSIVVTDPGKTSWVPRAYVGPVSPPVSSSRGKRWPRPRSRTGGEEPHTYSFSLESKADLLPSRSRTLVRVKWTLRVCLSMREPLSAPPALHINLPPVSPSDNLPEAAPSFVSVLFFSITQSPTRLKSTRKKTSALIPRFICDIDISDDSADSRPALLTPALLEPSNQNPRRSTTLAPSAPAASPPRWSRPLRPRAQAPTRPRRVVPRCGPLPASGS